MSPLSRELHGGGDRRQGRQNLRVVAVLCSKCLAERDRGPFCRPQTHLSECIIAHPERANVQKESGRENTSNFASHRSDFI